MSQLIELIISSDESVRNRSLEAECKGLNTKQLLEECKKLEQFRQTNDNLYYKVRALFFLHAIHRYYLPYRSKVNTDSVIPFEAYEHILKRRFEEAIKVLLRVQSKMEEANEGVSSGLAEAYHQLAFQTLADQVRKSVRQTAGNQWMFRISHPDDHPLHIRKELVDRNPDSGLFPIVHERTPVRMDITHCGWSDIFFLGMDFPQGAQVLNVSVNLCVRDEDVTSNPLPPISTYLRVIDEPVLKLTSIDLNTSSVIDTLDDVFDFAQDYLGLLKAGVIASGIVPPGMEGAGIPLSHLLHNLVGPNKGLELVTEVYNIPKGSRLAVSTNLLASIISVCMRATSQTKSLTGPLLEEERKLVAARAILGEWIGGSGGGWQDSGGVWPGIKLIQGIEAKDGDPEFGISKGRLLPKHTILTQEEISAKTRKKLQDSLVIIHGGMAQDVGPILEMVTEKHLLRSEKEWNARKEVIKLFDSVVNSLKEGNIQGLGAFTQQNFEEPLQEIIPWTSNMYTETLIKKVETHFGDNFWGFWMMGGMSGGGMGFIFHPDHKKEGQNYLAQILKETKQQLQHAVAFAMEPVIYDFEINENGTHGEMHKQNDALMPGGYYKLTVPDLLKKDIHTLTAAQRSELELLGNSYQQNAGFNNFVPELFERMIPQKQKGIEAGASLSELLKNHGFDAQLHNQIKADLKAGRIGLAQNRLPVNSKIRDVNKDEVVDTTESLAKEDYNTGLNALKNGELAVVTLAGGVGSRWTKGAGVVKSLNPLAKIEGKHRNFIESHLAKSRKIGRLCGTPLAHVFTTSYLTHQAIQSYLHHVDNYNYEGPLHLSEGRVVGQRLIPVTRDLRFLWEEMPQQLLDEQAQKMQDSLRKALINWALSNGEGEDYTDNLPHQCIHPVGHWFEIPNMFLNGTLLSLLKERPNLKYLLIHNIDTLGANADPARLGQHINSGNALTTEVITRKIDDRGGGLANIDGRIRLIEGMALPNEEIEFNLTYYNSNTTWVNLDDLLHCFQLTKEDLHNTEFVKDRVWRTSRRMPTYITIKDVKKRWGKGQEDIYPVTQFEKLWGDMTALDELNCGYTVVPRMRGQQLKEVAQLDGWLRDGSAKYLIDLCEWV